MTLVFPNKPNEDLSPLKHPVHRTIAGRPIELSADAPQDKVVMHPALYAEIAEYLFSHYPTEIIHTTEEKKA